MGRIEDIPAKIDENGEVVPLEFGETTVDRFAATKIFIAAINVGHQLTYCRQSDPNSRSYSDWQTMGQETYYYPLDCATTLAGDVAIVAISVESGHVQYFVETPNKTDGDPEWLPPEDLGAPDGVDLAGASAIQLAQDFNGRDCVFVSFENAETKGVYWIYRNPPKIVEKTIEITPPGSDKPIKVTVKESEPANPPWSDWESLTGSLKSGLKTMQVTNNADGRLAIIGNPENSPTYVLQQTSENPYAPDKWGDWVVPGGNSVATTPQLTKAILDNSGRISIFGNFAGTLKRVRQTTACGDSWDDWSIPGLIESPLGDFGLSIDGDGCLYVAGLNEPEGSASVKLFTNRESDSMQASWTGWEWSAMTPSGTAIEMSYSADGTISALVLDTSSGGDILVFDQVGTNASEWYAEPTNIGGHVHSFALTRDMTP